MDAAEAMWQANHIDTLPTFAADVDHAQVGRGEHHGVHDLTGRPTFECPNAQFVGVEAGSAQRLLTEQIAHAHSHQVHGGTAQAPSSYLPQQHHTGIQASFSAPGPASMPRNIVARSANLPAIAVSDWSPYGVTPGRGEMARMPRSAPQYAPEDMFFNTPSTSFRSTESAMSPWYDETESEYLARPDLDLQSPITSQSPLSLAGPHIWSGGSVSTPQAIPQDLRATWSYAESSTMPQELHISFKEPSVQTTVHYSERDGSDLNQWVQGAYTVSDRTHYGGLVPQAGNTSSRRRRVSRSRAGSVVSLSCGHEGCDKTFASKSARE